MAVLFTTGIEPCAGDGRPSSVELTDLDHLFGKLVQPVARAVTADQVIVAQPVEIASVGIGRVHDDVHVLLDFPWLVMTNQRALDHVIPLAVAIKPRFLRPSIFAHEGVERVPNLLTGSAGLEKIESQFASPLDELEFIFHYFRYFHANNAGATQLCVHPAGSVIFNEKSDRIPLLNDATLNVPLTEFSRAESKDRRFVSRHRSAEINPILTAVTLTVILCGRGDFGISHA